MRWLDGITGLTGTTMSKLLEMVKDREAWSAAVYGVAKSWTRWRDQTTTYLCSNKKFLKLGFFLGQELFYFASQVKSNEACKSVDWQSLPAHMGRWVAEGILDLASGLKSRLGSAFLVSARISKSFYFSEFHFCHLQLRTALLQYKIT